MLRGAHRAEPQPLHSAAPTEHGAYVEKLALTAVDYPPMQDPALFNLDAVKKKIQEMIKSREGQ